MPDSLPVHRLSPVEAARHVGHNFDRRSPRTGLPILSTEKLSQAERELLRQLARAIRLGADRVDEALDRGRVEHGLEALLFVETIHELAAKAAVELGRSR